MAGLDDYSVMNALNAQLGQNGAELVTDTAAHAVRSYAIHFITESVIAALISHATKGYTGNSLTGLSLPAGTVIFGNFLSLTLTSGKAIMYKEGDNV